jgi:hypothetical protein
LIKNQADVNARDKVGNTPLHHGNTILSGKNPIRFIISLFLSLQ